MEAWAKIYKKLQPYDRITIASLKRYNNSIQQITSMLQGAALMVRQELSQISAKCVQEQLDAIADKIKNGSPKWLGVRHYCRSAETCPSTSANNPVSSKNLVGTTRRI